MKMTNNNYKKIIVFLRILILILIVLLILLKKEKRELINFKSKFYNNFKMMSLENTLKTYNSSNNIKSDIFNGKITILNVYDINNVNYLFNLKLSKNIKKHFEDVNIIDIFIKNENDVINDQIFDLIEDKNEDFISKNNINRPVVLLSKSMFEQYFNLSNIENKIIILDELGNIKNIEKNDITFEELSNKIIEISEKKKKIYKKQQIEYENILDVDNNFIKKFNKFILIENFKHYDFPVFAILDDNNNIIITKINGDILYNINNTNSCKISSIKYIKKELYISDMCNYSISKINFDEQKIETVIQNKELFGISDFEFLNNNELLISKQLENGIGIFNISKNSYNSLDNILNFEYVVGKVSKIVYKYNKYYYFDVSNNILYSYNNKINKEEINLNEDENIIILDELDNFYINSKNNIYFMDNKNHRILHYNDGLLYEKNFKNFLTFPNDLLIYKNIYYVLSNNNVQVVNVYNNNHYNLDLYFSNNRQSFFNIPDNINIDVLNQKQFSLKNNNQLKINDIINDISIIPYSPSFIIVFEKNNNDITPIKIFYYNSLIDNDTINFESNKDYMIYGKIYYNNTEDNQIKIKNINIFIDD